MSAGRIRAVVMGGVLAAGLALAEDPFQVEALQSRQGTAAVVVVRFKVPQGHHLYDDSLAVRVAGAEQPRLGGDGPVNLRDAFSEASRASHTGDFSVVYALPAGAQAVEVSYQGCDEATCFFPQTRTVRLGGVPAPGGEAVSGYGPGQAPGKAAGLAVRGRASGYLRTGEFLAFLDRVEGKTRAGASGAAFSLRVRFRESMALFGSDPLEFFRQHGVWWTFLIILLGGVLLNLTPCVLPMIPINLAIIGAGAQDGSRMRGFALGGVYGFGMALVYGVLGLAVVLTGARFGAVNSLPVFNAAMAAVFAVLGLAMFDFVAIDFSRFQGNVGGGALVSRKGSVLVALVMGGLAALLAGACVAPVVIAVLLLAGKLYAAGVGAGILLPFLLGVGMALPWPLAGAGLSFLPRPGAWMTWVKRGFGVFILVLAAYYGHVAWQGWRGTAVARGGGQESDGTRRVNAAVPGSLEAVLGEAGSQGKPVFLDFWATWCKNCEAMEATTFRNAEVKARLGAYLTVKVQAERPGDPAVKALLDRFEVRGLPTYVILGAPVAGSVSGAGHGE